MVTMVRPTRHPALWHQIWANVRCGGPPAAADLPRVFPWLAPTVTSKDDRPVTPETAHPLQCWWGMPRRIRLDFQTVTEPRPCGLTGVADTVVVASWRQRPHGPKYVTWGGVHPLTPTYQVKPETEKLALHPQPGGVGYRHWLGLVLADATGLRAPAKAVAEWRDRFQDVGEDARLLAAGYDMDNMKSRGFVETEMPLPAARDKETQARTDALARRLVRAAEQVASLLRSAVRNALFSAGATVKIDAELLSSIRERLWSATEAAFFDALEHAASGLAVPEGAAEAAWQRDLRNTALALFDEAAPMDPDVPPMVRAGEAVPRLVRARRNLVFAPAGLRQGRGSIVHHPWPLQTAAQGGEEKENRMILKRGAAAGWWASLQDDADGRRGANRAVLARLRHCATVAQAMQEPSAIMLFNRVGATGPNDLPIVALTAAVLAHVRADAPGNTVARSVGPVSVEQPETAVLKPLRFRRLLEASGLDERLTGFRRLAALAGGKLPVADLAASLLDWNEDRRRRWVYDYWNAGQPSAARTPAHAAAPLPEDPAP